jgi:hypothetical protein
MVRYLLVISFLLIVLIGCSDSKQKSDKEFKEAYERNFIPSCVSSALKNNVSEDLARQKCSCLAHYMTEHYAPSELSQFSSTSTPETKKMFDAAFAACK